MQVQIRTLSEDAPAMHMWEWFDLWALDQAVREIYEAEGLDFIPVTAPIGALFESTSGRARTKQWKQTPEGQAAMASVRKERDRRDPKDMSPEEQHAFYLKHLNDILVHHGRMDPEKRKARRAGVEAWRRKEKIGLQGQPGRDIKDKKDETPLEKRQRRTLSYPPVETGVEGHDVRSHHASHKVLDAIIHGGSRDKRHRFLHSHEHFKEQMAELPAGMDPEQKHREMDAIFKKAAFIRPGPDVQPTETKQIRRARELLQNRIAYQKKHNKREVDEHHPLSLQSIANSTGMTHGEVDTLHTQMTSPPHAYSTPVREMARIAKKRAEEGVRLTHDVMAKILSGRMKSAITTATTGKGTPQAFRRKMQKRGQPSVGPEGKETSPMSDVEYIPGQTRAALRATVKSQHPPHMLHHPGSRAGQENPQHASVSAAHHERLIDALNKAHAQSQLPFGQKARTVKRVKTEWFGEAEESEKKKKEAFSAKSSVNIGDAINLLYHHGGHSTSEIGHLLNVPVSHVEGHLSGKRMPRAADTGARARGLSVPEANVERRIRAKKKSRGVLSPGEAVKADLEDLYPLRGKREEGENEIADELIHKPAFAKTIHKMYHGDPAKGIAPKPHIKHQKKVKGEAGQTVMGTFGTLQAYPTGLPATGLDHPGEFDEDAAKKAFKGDQKKIEQARKKHQKNLDDFHDNLAQRHENVHKVMHNIIDDMTNRKHPLTQQWYDHHHRLAAARAGGDEDTVKHLEDEAKKKVIKDDLLDHHLNHAADKPEVQETLSVKGHKHARNALGNIFRRIQQHGTHWMHTATAHGLNQEKARAHGKATRQKPRSYEPPQAGDPMSKIRIRVPHEISKAGGDLFDPSEEDAPEGTKNVHRGEKYYAPSAGSMASRVMDTRARQERSAGGPEKLAQQQGEEGRRLSQHRARVKNPKGAGGPIGPFTSDAAKKRAKKARERMDREEREREELAKKTAAAPESHRGPAENPPTHVAQGTPLGTAISQTRPSRTAGRAVIGRKDIEKKVKTGELPSSALQRTPLAEKPKQKRERGEQGRPGEQKGTFTRSETGQVKQEESLFVRTALVLLG